MKLFKKFLGRADMVIPPVLLLVITYFVYMPMILFLGNIDEFSVDFSKVAPLIAVVSIAAFLILAVVGFMLVWEKVSRVYTTLIFGIALGFYVQGNFLNPDFGVLNGASIPWEDYTTASVISAAAWVVCIVGPQVLLFFKKNIAAAVMKWGSYLLCAMQVVALVTTILTTEKTVNAEYGLVKKDEFKLSSKENVVVFVVDTLDVAYYEEMIESDASYEKHLNDFTYYDNCIAGGSPTILGIPAMLTGQQYDDLSVGLFEYMENAYDANTLFKDLKANNYRTSLFTDYLNISGLKTSEVDNLVETGEYVISDKKGFIKEIYRLGSFYSMPTLLKRYFWFYSGDFEKYVKLEGTEHDLYKLDDHQFKNDYNEQGITTQDDENVFAYYHLMGAHPPHILDENLEVISDDSGTKPRQTKGTFNMIFRFIDDMKAKGIYDNSTIIITGDHGEQQLFQSPAVLVKKKNEHKEYTTNSAPVTFANLRATFASESMDDYSAYGENLDDVPENDNRVRYNTTHIIHQNVVSDKDAIDSTFSRFRFTGNTRDMDKCSVVSTSNNPKKDSDK